MSVTLNGTSGLVFGDGTIQGTAGAMAFRNRIINGDMRIDQRNAGAAVTHSSGFTYYLDRWYFAPSQNAKMSIQQVDAPSGFDQFTKAAKLTTVSAFTPGATDYFGWDQAIEGYNIADLMWGTASAKTVSLSFWVQSSLTGTFGGSILAPSGGTNYPFTYTINAANTPEYKTVTIPGPTSGTFGKTNGVGCYVIFDMGSGSSQRGTAGSWQAGNFVGATGTVNVVSTNAATWFISGVQFEKAAAATSFEHRPYGTELAMCMRYFVSLPVEQRDTRQYSQNDIAILVNIPCVMRDAPSVQLASALTSGNTILFSSPNAAWYTFSSNTSIGIAPSGISSYRISLGFTGGSTQAVYPHFGTSILKFNLSSEL